MNRKQKIIVSVTGIFLVLLILVGLTYAYFLTQITGNTNPKSISVTTKNLSLTYDDGEGNILSSNTKLIPSSNAINTKTFKVINNGDKTDYVVIIDNVVIKDLATGMDTTFKTNDFVYTLECKNLSDDSDCTNQINSQTTLPLINNSILITNDIGENEEHNYILTLWYLNKEYNQGDDMNKSLSARINIEDIRRINPYSDNTNSLEYNIINNSIFGINGTNLLAKPHTKVAEEQSQEVYDKVLDTEKLNSIKSTTVSTKSKQNVIDIFNTDNRNVAIQACIGNGNCSYTFSTCSDIKNEYIYNTATGDGYYVNNCTSEGAHVYSFFYNIDEDELDLTVEEKELYKEYLYKDNERTLSIAHDDYGTSYYYRGDVKDNYINFAGMCWRIVRIDGNGNTKLVLEDKNTTCDSDSYTGNWNIGDSVYGNSYHMNGNKKHNIMVIPSISLKNYIFQTELSTKISEIYGKNIENILINTPWCINDSAYDLNGTTAPYNYTLRNDALYYDTFTDVHYDAYVRLGGENSSGYNPTLICNGKKIDYFERIEVGTTVITDNVGMYVGGLTADETVFAGAKYYNSNYNYYLLNSEYAKGTEGEIGRVGFWLLTPARYTGTKKFDIPFNINYKGSLSSGYGVEIEFATRPVIVLKSGIEVTGKGTKTAPYNLK